MRALTVVLAVLSVFAVAVPGYGESTRLSGTIPFAFVAGDQTLPAGEYTLASSQAGPGTWILNGKSKQAGLYLATTAGNHKTANESPRLVFSRYGDQYFLSQIWIRDSDCVLQLPVSKTERSAAKTSAARGTTTVAMP